MGRAGESGEAGLLIVGPGREAERLIQSTGFGDHAAERIVGVGCRSGLAAIEHSDDVPLAVIKVSVVLPALVHAEKAAEAAFRLQSPGIITHDVVGAVAFLDRDGPLVNKTRLA